ncbi:MAG: DsrE family protein [Hyphomonadaceae bacterium]
MIRAPIRTALLASVLWAGCATAACAQTPPTATTGPIIADYGKTFDVETDIPLPQGVEFKVAFDVAKAAEPGQLNRGFESVARFLNMHGKAGVPAERMHLVIVVHGGAIGDLKRETSGEDNANAGLVKALMDAGVKFEVCGQAAAAQGYTKGQLVPGVEMALSAMTAHALLAQQGYSENPF